jgi:hemerythrin-like domain-containing protein
MQKITCGLTILGIGFGMTLLARDRRVPHETESVGAATRQLIAEHEVILRVLDAAQSEADHIRRGFNLDENRVRDILNFSRNFTDRCHQAKEERYYFPAAEAYAGRRIYPFVEELQVEHAYGRSILDEIDSLLGSGDSDIAKPIAERLSTYADMLRGHIRKENEQLYQKANTFLPSTEERALLIGFDRIEYFAAVEFGPDFHERYRQLAEQLSQWTGRL